MRVLLVDNLIMPEEGSLAFLDVHPHMGLLALAAAAEAAGHTVQIYDPKRLIRSGHLRYDDTLYERIAGELLTKHPDVIGFTTLGCSFLCAIRVAAILKQKECDLPIVLGGPHATMLHRQILERFPQFDVIVRHEADEIFAAVLENLANRTFDQIPGMSWRASGKGDRLHFTDGKPKVENLDLLPIASYDHYPVIELGLDLLRIEAGRGCPFMCTFCSTASFFQRSFRLKSADRLVQELDILNARYGFTHFKLDHDMFTVSRQKVLTFCEAVKDRSYRWEASARVDCVDTELLTKMADSGCVGLYFGIETGSKRMQEICHKRLDLNLVEPILSTAASLGIETTASFITGYPEELDIDQADTLDLLGHCYRPSCLPQLHMLAPEPGTPMFERLGDKIQYDGYGGRYNAKLVGNNDENLILDHPDIFQTYYYYPAEMPRYRYIFAVEVVDILRRAGPIILCYSLRAFDGKLSKLIEDLRLFAMSCNFAGRPNAGLVEDYMISQFGRSHHLTSLFRFALRGQPEGESILADQSQPVYSKELTYVLSPNVHLLSNLHDCGRLIELVKKAPLGAQFIDEADAGELGSYILKASYEGPTIYKINAGVEAILEIFQTPTLCRAVEDLLCEIGETSDIDSDFIQELVQVGILVSRDISAIQMNAKVELSCNEPE